MPVYVDSLMERGWVLGKSCHMIADSLPELHALAKAIGLKEHWFQERSTPHYDLTESRRARAVAAGAIELERRAFVKKLRALRAFLETGATEDMPWGLRGRITGSWQGPLLLTCLGTRTLLPAVELSAGETIEYWLVIADGHDHYEWKRVEEST